MPDILFERADGVATITLNRPEKLNAINFQMWGDLKEMFEEVAGRREDRVLVVTGAAGAFCSGADLGASREQAGTPLAHMRRVGAAALALHRLAKPTIARVDGVAAGAGLNLALGCDLVAASDRSRFSEIFAKRGLSVDFGGSWLLPRRIGLHKAKELVLLADIIDASEAAEIGLVNRVVPAVDLDGLVADWVAKLLAGPPQALSISKRLLDHGLERSMDEVLEAEAQGQAVNIAGPEAAEALVAFLEKRPPRFEVR